MTQADWFVNEVQGGVLSAEEKAKAGSSLATTGGGLRTLLAL